MDGTYPISGEATGVDLGVTGSGPGISVDQDGSPLGTTAQGARGLWGRRLGWVVGGILGVVGAAMALSDLRHHHHANGPYLLTAAFLLFFLAALDMWRVERSKARAATRTVRRLSARVDRQEENVQHLRHDRDQWRKMQSEEALANRRLTEELQRAQKPPQVPGGVADVVSTGPPPPPRTVQKPPPRHSRRGPAANQPALFDQDEEV
jgi:hypothetical protein